MVEPLQFGYNPEMSSYNPLQQPSQLPAEEVSELARKELLSVVSTLKAKGIKVILVQDDEFQQTPSSVFPASWISFHENSHVVAYPLASENRKPERRGNILNVVVDNDFPIYDIVDISVSENEGKFLHGTESVVLDRVNKVAYGAISPLMDEAQLKSLASKFGYFPLAFPAAIDFEDRKLPILTNQMLTIADRYAIICLEAIVDIDERNLVKNILIEGEKEIVEITCEQVKQFAGSGIQLESVNGKKILVLSSSAYDSLTEEQLKTIKPFNEIVTVDIPVIEQVGGASVSSIVSGVFLPK